MLYELGYSLQANRKTKEGGRHPEWRPRGNPYEVRVHDFIDPSKGKAIPYGVYDLGLNRGWVSVGIDHETASFAVNTILQCA
jgi:hypothetical protein